MDVVGACSVYFVVIAYVFSVGAILIFCRTSYSTFSYFTGGLRATCLSKISSSVSFPSSMLIYSIGSIAGVSPIVDGGSAGVGIFCPFVLVFSFTVFCSSRTARVHMDSPSKSSTSFRRLLCLSMVFVSSWSDGDLSTPFILRWCLAPRPAWSYFSTAVIFSIIAVWVWGDLAFAATYVEGSFSYSTIVSTSSRRAR